MTAGIAGAGNRFFEQLAHKGHESLLGRVTGTIRCDVRSGDNVEHWYVTVKRGDVVVSHQDAPADAVLRVDRATLDGMTAGTVNSMAAVLRGVVGVEGDLGLVIRFQRLFPGPPRPGPAPQ